MLFSPPISQFKHTSNSNTSSSNTQTFQFPAHHMSPPLSHRLKHVRLKHLRTFFNAGLALGCLAIKASSASMVFLWIFPFLYLAILLERIFVFVFQKPFFSYFLICKAWFKMVIAVCLCVFFSVKFFFFILHSS